MSRNISVSESVISIVRIMSFMTSSDGIDVTCVICVVVRDEVCSGVRGVVLVLSVVLLRQC
jgi:hypothetical protein